FAFDVTGKGEARAGVEALAIELERAVTARDEFLSVASHELRTPLTAVKLQVQGLLHMVERGRAEQLAPEKLAARVDTVNRLVNRLGELVSNLLDISRITTGRLGLDLEEVDVAALARDVAARAR